MVKLTELERLERSLSEAEFREQVHDLAALLGWQWMYVFPLKSSKGWRTPTGGPLGSGWPDDTLVHRAKRRIVFAEVKSQTGAVRADQAAVLAFLREAGQEAYLWRPSDLPQIQEVLSR
jgi:hypothetical protein